LNPLVFLDILGRNSCLTLAKQLYFLSEVDQVVQGTYSLLELLDQVILRVELVYVIIWLCKASWRLVLIFEHAYLGPLQFLAYNLNHIIKLFHDGKPFFLRHGYWLTLHLVLHIFNMHSQFDYFLILFVNQSIFFHNVSAVLVHGLLGPSENFGGLG